MKIMKKLFSGLTLWVHTTIVRKLISTFPSRFAVVQKKQSAITMKL